MIPSSNKSILKISISTDAIEISREEVGMSVQKKYQVPGPMLKLSRKSMCMRQLLYRSLIGYNSDEQRREGYRLAPWQYPGDMEGCVIPSFPGFPFDPKDLNDPQPDMACETDIARLHQIVSDYLHGQLSYESAIDAYHNIADSYLDINACSPRQLARMWIIAGILGQKGGHAEEAWKWYSQAADVIENEVLPNTLTELLPARIALTEIAMKYGFYHRAMYQALFVVSVIDQMYLDPIYTPLMDQLLLTGCYHLLQYAESALYYDRHALSLQSLERGRDMLLDRLKQRQLLPVTAMAADETLVGYILTMESTGITHPLIETDFFWYCLIIEHLRIHLLHALWWIRLSPDVPLPQVEQAALNCGDLIKAALQLLDSLLNNVQEGEQLIGRHLQVALTEVQAEIAGEIALIYYHRAHQGASPTAQQWMQQLNDAINLLPDLVSPLGGFAAGTSRYLVALQQFLAAYMTSAILFPQVAGFIHQYERRAQESLNAQLEGRLLLLRAHISAVTQRSNIKSLLRKAHKKLSSHVREHVLHLLETEGYGRMYGTMYGFSW